MTMLDNRCLSRQGGVHKCRVCGEEKPLGSVTDAARHGWPLCCGYRMRWLTAADMAREASVREPAAPAWSRLRLA